MVDTSGAEKPQDHGLSEEQAQRIATRYRLSPSQFGQLSEQRQQRILFRLRNDDLPQQRAAFFAQFRRGDDGEIAPDGFTLAADRLVEMRASPPPALRGRVAGMSVGPLPETPHAVLEHTSGLAPDNTGWTWLGPGNIGGRIRSILITSSTPRKIYVGSVGGGIWTSTNGGASWQPADDLMANLAICSMAMVPNDPNTIYAGTGEGFIPDGAKNDEIQGNGIFKTTDGRIWKQLPSTKATPTNQDFLKVNAIAIDRNGIVLAGTRTGVFRSIDGGKNWSKVLPAAAPPPPAPPPPPAIIGNILFDPTNDSKCIAGLLQGGGIYYSTDGGANWTRSTYPTDTPIGRIQVCYAKKDPSIVYASVEALPSGVNAAQIWKSTNGGASFTKKNNTTNYLDKQGWYDNIIWAGDPNDADFVIVGGVDLYKSIDGGDSISPISAGLTAGSVHADHHVIVADPGYNGSSNNTVYFGNDGGLYKADNVKTVAIADGWTNLNSKLPITQFYSLSGKFTTTGSTTTITSVVGGAQDNGTMRYTPAEGANDWSTWFGGDGGSVASDWNNANNYYGEYVYLQIFRSTDGGSTGQYICGLRPDGTKKPAPYCIDDMQNNKKALFVAPFILDPTTPLRLIAGGSSLWRTHDATAPNTMDTGPTWEVIKPPLPAPDDKALVSAIAKPANFAQMLVGYSNGQIYKSDDLPLWERVGTVIGATRMCTSLTIDKKDIERFYATFGGFQSDNIWTSWNAGTNWRSLGATLPQAPIYCVAIHPENSDWIYLGTETGIFASEDGGLTWAPNNEGPTNCVVYQLAWLGNTLCCATHGRGAFAIDLTIRQQASRILTGDRTGTLSAFNPTGSAASSYRVPNSQITTQPLVDGTSVYCAYANIPGQYPGLVAKFRGTNPVGNPEWQVAFSGSVNVTPSLVKATYPGDPDVLYVFGSDGLLTAVDVTRSTPLWAVQVVPSGQVGAGVTAYSNQVMNQWIYIATSAGLYAVDIAARIVAWGKSLVCTAPPLFVSNTVIVPAQDGKLHSIQARTGIENWACNSGNVSAAPVWVQGSVIAGNLAGQLMGIDYSSGTQQFSLPFPNEQIRAIAADGNEIYFTGNAVNGHLYAYRLDIATRGLSPLWGANLAGGSTSPPQIVGTSLYLTTTTGTLQAFNTANGRTLWPQPPSLPGVAPGAPALVYS